MCSEQRELARASLAERRRGERLRRHNDNLLRLREFLWNHVVPL